MTSNQIAYWTLRENQRANRAKELETQRSNLAQEAVKERAVTLDEQIKPRQASVAEREVAVKEDLAPAQKSQMTTQAVRNVFGSIKDVADIGSNYLRSIGEIVPF